MATERNSVGDEAIFLNLFHSKDGMLLDTVLSDYHWITRSSKDFSVLAGTSDLSISRKMAHCCCTGMGRCSYSDLYCA